jgi:hypothetical protein
MKRSFSEKTVMYNDEIEHYRSILDDVTLLASAIWIDDSLAVPVGGSRSGGYCICDCDHSDVHLRRLSKLPGFPNVRFVPSGKDYCANIVWGKNRPKFPKKNTEYTAAKHSIEEGRYFGYSEKAICNHLVQFYEPKLIRSIMKITN